MVLTLVPPILVGIVVLVAWLLCNTRQDMADMTNATDAQDACWTFFQRKLMTVVEPVEHKFKKMRSYVRRHSSIYRRRPYCAPCFVCLMKSPKFLERLEIKIRSLISLYQLLNGIVIVFEIPYAFAQF